MNGWRLEHTYAGLPALFFSDVSPTPVRDPQLVVFNVPLAADLGLDAAALDSPAGAAVFAGNTLPEGARPIAQAYAGHQFGHFTALGDGRAILIGEHITPDGRRVDIQLKGAGRTPYSRAGDGRAALGPMLRELIISEAMSALEIPTSRSLAVVATGEPVYRERVLPGAVLTRVAASHLRVGTFQWAAAHRDVTALRGIADYTIARHYPHAADSDRPYLALFEAIADRQAELIAKWQLVGFVHGVMNTDNMALSGETLDYGPCAFMDKYDPDTVFSSIDAQGRYSYANQPGIAQWNLARFGEALLPLLDANPDRRVELASEVVARFAHRFEEYWLAGMRAKLGLFAVGEGDAGLAEQLLAWMDEAGADYADTFRRLSTPGGMNDVAEADATFRTWLQLWRARLAEQRQAPEEVTALMQRHNPSVVPRNHKVEEALTAATDQGDLEPIRQLLDALARPYDYTRSRSILIGPPDTAAPHYRTFCGT